MDIQAKFTVLLHRDEIDARVRRLAGEISREYRTKHPVLIGVLKGSFIFLADLIRQLDFPLDVDFIRLSSYGQGTTSAGEVRVEHALRNPIKGRHVLVIEDIVDTGITISFLLNFLEKEQPASLKLCALTDKPSRRQVPVKIDFTGFTVPDKFIVGYGLDWNEQFRHLPDICVLED